MGHTYDYKNVSKDNYWKSKRLTFLILLICGPPPKLAHRNTVNKPFTRMNYYYY